jgi:hypothetical protein
MPHHEKPGLHTAQAIGEQGIYPQHSPAQRHHFWRILFRPFSLGCSLFHHHQSPPAAQALQRIGIIRTISQDGSYVIVELDPGIFLPPGRTLFVTTQNGETARLRSAESQPPYFNADVESGQPEPGQVVQQ